MTRRIQILVLPISILFLASLVVYSYISEWSLALTLYFFLITIVAIYTARQSVFIQTSLIWDIQNAEANELDEVSISIVKDYISFFLVHSLIVSVIYAIMFWSLKWAGGA